MKNTETISSNSARCHRTKPFRTSAALTLATFMLVVVAATTAATAQTYTVLYNFGSKNGDPNGPYQNVIAQGRDGSMYSTTADQWTGGAGEVFKITPEGILTVLHKFNGADGQSPHGGLTLAVDGNFYGTTASGGSSGYGTIFRITPGGKLTTLYNFTGGTDGSVPIPPPIQGLDGNFYGTTSGEGRDNGSIYKISRSGVFTTLHTFDGTDGADPHAPLVQGTDGNFYGTTLYGGNVNTGTIFRISSSGKFKVLLNFGHGHGRYSVAPLIQGSDGNFYGVNDFHWANQTGVAFKITPQGKFTALHNFTGGSDGGNQVGGLTQATDGNIYGTNNLDGGAGWGVLFRTDSTGAFTALHDFDWGSGASPQTTMLQHTNGVLYGATDVGGTGNNGEGTFYSFDVGLGPFVSFLPAAGKVGKTIEFLGQGFTGTISVSFNGTAATFGVVSDTYLTATVPAGATSGFVAVVTPGGTLTSNKEFRVSP